MQDQELYVKLLEKLNYQNPKSKYLLRILEKMATPDDARLLLELPADMAVLTQKTGMKEEDVRKRLRDMVEKGLAIDSGKGPRFVRSISQLHDANLSSNSKYIDEELLDLWRDFYETEWFPTMNTLSELSSDPYVKYVRVVPAWPAIEKSGIAPEDIPPEENLKQLVEGASAIAVVPCTCRISMRRCNHDVDNCVQFNKGAEYAINRGAGRRLSVDEAMKIFNKAAEDGLVHTWPFALAAHLNEVCNCCADCCGTFEAGLKFNTVDGFLQRTHYRPQVDLETCNGCQDCVERCFFGALEMKKYPNEKKLKVSVDETKCFGCGVCVVGCPVDALTLKPHKD